MLNLIQTQAPDSRTFWLGRPTVGALGRCLGPFCAEAGEFARDHSDDQIYRQRTFEFEDFARDGRMAVVLNAPRFERRCLVGVALCLQSEDDEGLSEICTAVIDPRFRRLHLGTSAARALAVQECAEADAFTGVFTVAREDNDPCRHAMRTLGADLHRSAEMIRLYPSSAGAVEGVETRMVRNNRVQKAVFSMMGQPVFQAGARMLLDARSSQGCPLKNEVKLRTGPGWYPDDEGFWGQVELIARGWMPRTPTPPRRLSA